MAQYTAKHLRWAKKKAAGVVGESFPTYETAMDMGPLASVAETINTSRAENYGDDELQEFVDEFVSLTLAATVTEMPVKTAAAVYGALENKSGGISYKTDDVPPEGCLGVVTGKMYKNASGVLTKAYQGVFYPNVTGSRQGTTFNTKGNSITFANSACNFTGKAEENGFHTVLSGNLGTEAEAIAWIDKMCLGGADALAEANAATE